MSLKSEQHQQLHKALLQAFDNAELRRLVRFALDEDLDAITGEGAREDRVFELIDTVDRQMGKLAKCNSLLSPPLGLRMHRESSCRTCAS